VHEGLPLDWGFDVPSYWDGPRSDDDFVSEDLCIWTDDGGDLAYFIRGVLELPIVGAGERFAYGVWSSLSEQSFNRVVELWDDPRGVEEERYFGWLSNSIPGYPETLNLPLEVVTRHVDLRPSFWLHDGEHPLIRDQREGITRARVREVAEQLMHR